MQQQQVTASASLSVMIGSLAGIVYRSIQPEDVIKTSILAATGTVVSFILSLLLKLLYKRFRK